MVLQKGYSGIFISSPGRRQIKKRTTTNKQTESWESFIKYLEARTKDIALMKEHKQAVGHQGPTQWPEFAHDPGKLCGEKEFNWSAIKCFFLKDKITLGNKVSKAGSKYPCWDPIRAEGIQSRGRTALGQNMFPEFHWLTVPAFSLGGSGTWPQH